MLKNKYQVKFYYDQESDGAKAYVVINDQDDIRLRFAYDKFSKTAKMDYCKSRFCIETNSKQFVNDIKLHLFLGEQTLDCIVEYKDNDGVWEERFSINYTGHEDGLFAKGGAYPTTNNVSVSEILQINR